MNYTFGQVHFFVHRSILTKIEFCVEENVLYLIKRKNLTTLYFICQVQADFLQNEHCKSGACTCMPS